MEICKLKVYDSHKISFLSYQTVDLPQEAYHQEPLENQVQLQPLLQN